MQVHQHRCPNCSRKFCFPVEYGADQFLVVCSHCYVGYHLLKVEVDEEFLGRLLVSRSLAPFWQKNSKHLFQYLRSVATNFRFITPEQPNAIIFQVARARSLYPLAVYFHNAYYQIRAYNSLLLSLLLTIPGALALLSLGFSLVPVLIGASIAIVCFTQFIALPKIKGTSRKRLIAEQLLLQQGYELQQSLSRVLNVRLTHQNLLNRQKSVWEKMMLTPSHYPDQIDLYQRAMKCTDDYLNLCARAISQYELAIRAIDIQIETSKLSDELPDRFVDPQLEFGLSQLEDQLTKTIPPKFANYDPNDSYN